VGRRSKPARRLNAVPRTYRDRGGVFHLAAVKKTKREAAHVVNVWLRRTNHTGKYRIVKRAAGWAVYIKVE